MHREFKTYGFEQLLLSSVHSVQYLMVNYKRDLRKVMLISTHTCPSLALWVPSFLCPFPHHTKDTPKHSHLLKTINVLTGVLPPLPTTIPDFKTSMQEIPSPVHLLQLFSVLWEPLLPTLQDTSLVPPDLLQKSAGPHHM